MTIPENALAEAANQMRNLAAAMKQERIRKYLIRHLANICTYLVDAQICIEEQEVTPGKPDYSPEVIERMKAQSELYIKHIEQVIADLK